MEDGKIKRFFEKLDDKLEGIPLYDWYWSRIWCPIWRVLYNNPKERKNQKKYEKQRVQFGISEEDCWSMTDWLLETTYKGFEFFIVGEYGKEPIDWSSRPQCVHTKQLYNKIMKYRYEYERLMYIQERLAKFDYGNDSVEVWVPEFREIEIAYDKQREYCCKLLKNILNNYMEVLWW